MKTSHERDARTTTHAGEWIDVSVPLRSGMVHWPSDPPVRIEHFMDMAKGDAATTSKLSMCAHAGTHMDAPIHFVAGGKGLDQLPLDVVIGPARVLLIEHPQMIAAEELRRHEIKQGERILFKTRNSERCWKTDTFIEDFVHLTQEACRMLVDAATQLVGVDYLSVGGYKKDGPAVHRMLLGAGIWIIEGLDLSRVKPGSYSLVCLPLRIIGGDGAPARAVLQSLI